MSTWQIFKSSILSIFERQLGHIAENRKQKDVRRRKISKSCHLTKEQKKEAIDFYKKYYGKKISLKWHKLYTAISGKFDHRYFPELLYTPDFQRLSNSPSYRTVFSDKNLLPLVLDGANICAKTPKAIAYSSNGILYNSANQIISKEELLELLKKEQRFFIKPSTNSNSGHGCKLIIAQQDGFSNDYLTQLLSSYGKDFSIQNIITNQPDLKTLNPTSLNTFRVISYFVNGEIKTSPAILRVGVGNNFVDNAHAGGLFVAINNDGVIISNGKNEFGLDLEIHPTTNIRFVGYRIENFNKIHKAVKEAASLFPKIGVIDWDVTLDDKGEPIIIEANTYNGSIWLIQMAHGVSVFGEDTREILELIRKNKILY